LFGTTEPDPVSFYDYHQMWRENPSATPPDGKINAPDDTTPLHYLRRLLGDENLDDKITGTETLAEAPPYILLSRGPARHYTPKALVEKKFDKCQEISNLNER
jgi:hypothetical protein